MIRPDAWQMLGIDRTDDSRAIRRAYADRLRAIDVDADPDAFAALRAARGVALAEVSRAVSESMGLAAGDEQAAIELTIDAPPMAPAAQFDPADLHMQAITELLHAEHARPWLAADDKASMFDHWRDLMADPRMEEIDFLDRVERWAAWVIASTPPLSGPLIVHAVKRFGWTADEGKVTQPPILVEICRRHRMIRFLEAASKPDHPYYPAWEELHRHAYPESTRGSIHFAAIRDILNTVRHVMPELENRFDRRRVALWSENSADPDHPEAVREDQRSYYVYRGLSWLIGGYFALLFLLMLVGAMWKTPS